MAHANWRCQSRTLSRLCDVLLPQLMWGAVDVGRVSVEQGRRSHAVAYARLVKDAIR